MAVWLERSSCIIAGSKFDCKREKSVFLIDKALCQILKLVNSAVTQERPPAAYILTAVHIYIYNDIFFFQVAGLCQNFSLWSCDEAVSPELYAVGLA